MSDYKDPTRKSSFNSTLTESDVAFFKEYEEKSKQEDELRLKKDLEIGKITLSATLVYTLFCSHVIPTPPMFDLF